MNVKSIMRKSLCCAVLAASALTANAKLEVSSLKVVGEAIWCGYDDKSGVMLSNAENPDIYKATVYISTNGDGFKFLTYDGWGGELCPETNGLEMESGQAYKLCRNTGDDNKFKVKEAANYDIVCDVENEKITVTKSAYQDNPVKFTALWIVGGATPGGWSIDKGTPMAQDAVNPFKLTAKVYLNINGSDHEFKFATSPYKGFDQDMFVCHPSNDNAMILRNNAGKNVNDESDETTYEDLKWTITEAGTYYIEVDVLNMTISIKSKETISIGETGFATFCPSAPIDVESLSSDIMAYEASVDGTTVNLSKLSKIAAGEGVLLRSVKGGAVTVEAPVAGGEVLKSGSNAFVGVLENTTVQETSDGKTNYVLSTGANGIGFYKADNTLVAAGKAYLPVDNAGNAKALTLVFDGETTGISEVSAQKAAADNAYYTLSGVRVEKPVKGLYIVNGKKVVIK